VLTLHKVPARVTGGTATPRWVRFQVLPAVGANISRIKNLSEELAAALDAPSCRVSRRGAAVAVEVPRDDSQPVRLLPLYRQLVGATHPANDGVSARRLARDASPQLTQRGCEAGIHIIAATQKPTAAVLGPLVKANFSVRLVGRVTSIEDARTATG